MRPPSRQQIAASENDLKNNRLGLMSQTQILALEEHIGAFQARMSRFVRRSAAAAVMITAAVVILSFVRVVLLPMALMIEIAVIGLMIYMAVDFSRFVQQLSLDRESETVRIVKGCVSRGALRIHPLYYTLRVEAQHYKLLDPTLLKQFTAGELYQFYVLPQAGVVIAAEVISEKSAYYLA